MLKIQEGNFQHFFCFRGVFEGELLFLRRILQKSYGFRGIFVEEIQLLMGILRKSYYF